LSPITRHNRVEGLAPRRLPRCSITGFEQPLTGFAAIEEPPGFYCSSMLVGRLSSRGRSLCRQALRLASTVPPNGDRVRGFVKSCGFSNGAPHCQPRISRPPVAAFANCVHSRLWITEIYPPAFRSAGVAWPCFREDTIVFFRHAWTVLHRRIAAVDAAAQSRRTSACWPFAWQGTLQKTPSRQ